MPLLRSFPGLFLCSLLFLCSCSPKESSYVVVYTSQDRVYSEPILQEFTQKTGIPVRAVYDSEAVKTVGLANRLLEERPHPQCDVFWNNEELRTRQLAAKQVFSESPAWKSMGYRSRRIVINTNALALAAAPRTLMELTNTVWRGKVALAYPLFGTTATHFLALRQHWGENAWRAWCRALQANQPFLVDGNSLVVKLVGQGEAWLGLTDSDDIAAGQREKMPILALPLTNEMMLIPNSVAVVRQAPHPAAAQALYDYLLSRDTVERLVSQNALEGILVEANSQTTLSVDWEPLLAQLEPATHELKQIFLR